MKRISKIGVAAAVAAAWMWAVLPVEAQRTDVKLPEAASQLSQASNQFGFAMYQQLSGQPGNLFISPHSIHAALSMTLQGARGMTADQMAMTLGLVLTEHAAPIQGQPTPWIKRPVPELAQQYPLLLTGTEKLPGINPRKADDKRPHQLISVNALWGQEGHPFKPDFLKATRELFQGDLRAMGFTKDPDGARKTINAWVEEKTQQKIKDLLAPDTITRDTRLVLTNAVYFKSAWQHAFQKQATSDQPFKLADGKSVNVPTMRQTQRFKYAMHPECEMIELPYQRGELSMLVLLPVKPEGITALGKGLDADRLNKARKAMEEKRLDLSLPRFKFEAKYDLEDPLKAMGMTDAFDGSKADFSGIHGSRELAISKVVHKSFVDVNEEGTEAAAATAVVMKRMSLEMDEPTVVKVDRPFMFAIVHQSTGVILFLGRVSDPRN